MKVDLGERREREKKVGEREGGKSWNEVREREKEVEGRGEREEKRMEREEG